MSHTWHCKSLQLSNVLQHAPRPPPPSRQQDTNTHARVTCTTCLQDIEADCSRLLATGLFGRARPAAIPAKRGEAPQFGAVIPEQEDDQEEEQQEQGSSSSNKVRGTACVGRVSLVCSWPVCLSTSSQQGGTRHNNGLKGRASSCWFGIARC